MASSVPAKSQARQMESGGSESPKSSKWMDIYSHAWFQVLLISFICFCCPGMYNALTGLGGSGQVDATVAANANVALLSATAATALFFVGPIFSVVGPRACWLVGGWTYALYSASLLNFNIRHNGAFVIAAGGILGVGASFLWVTQGAIMTTYVPESQKGRAIAAFWIIFNLGGMIGSLASFGLNFNSKEGSVSNSTYIATMVIMIFGWVIGVFICPPSRIKLLQLHEAETTVARQSIGKRLYTILQSLLQIRVLCVLPLFFCANVFYSYQQNNVNGTTFNIRSRSLNSAIYWMAQMFGGLFMGYLLDFAYFNRRQRAWLGWATLLVTGMVIWGGGLAFQRWEDERLANGMKQDIDYARDAKIATGPIWLYFFYGAYDALWQGYCYWLIGTMSNSAAVAAVLVGAYKTFQAAGGAMAWRVNALGAAPLTQFAMDWGLCIGALVLAIPTVWMVTLTSVDEEGTMAEGKKVDESDDK
ncbi:UNC93-like protein [Trichophyton mentagrophytes]|uniref:Major facilitator superfamily (MFS) profile domain-containing protein n=1 Tax=Trichophyton interdigitale (strain MR816) TaxID=1215338 RepID=A0A059J6Y5_TRIIM|nr:hypothetical protein H101_02383 [Trichophyton interdigitale H6]KDB23569.1 hypothetical protein H109_04462 [Trichophyton interdigitale MR816]GBF61780.1 UNC93-like protein [Trichophyton mentagrophytes]